MKPPDPGTEYLLERQHMLERQLRSRGIRDERVLAAMFDVPRHRFVPEHLRHRAYEDCPWPIGEGQTISQPYIVARSCELAQLQPDDNVLEVGGGSGYQAAVLARLCKHVVSIELIPKLAEGARLILESLGFDNVEMITGDGTLGHAARAPYDAIVVAASAAHVPEPLIAQLARGGRLVLPLGTDYLQALTVLRKHGERLERSTYEDCVFVPLRGAAS